ncbi:MAG: hypothetical protein JNM66_08585 [Bryobacterales bacterium]|nr:hypothetical protein [Bryobacterales bacterium]
MRVRIHTTLLALFLGALISMTDAIAAPFFVYRSASAVACLGTIAVGDCSSGYERDDADSGLAQVSRSFSGAGNSLTVLSSGDASFGVLKASASASYNITGSPINAYGSGIAGFIDIITIDFAPWNGSTGLLNVYYTLDGTISSTGAGKGIANVFLSAGTDQSTSQSRVQTYTSSTSGVFSVGAPISFVYGQPFGLFFSLYACAGGGDLVGCGFPHVTGTGSGDADFSNTFVLSGLIPTDLNGNQAVGALFSSQSGTQYSVNGVGGVPEPASGILVMICLCAISARMRWRRTTS